MKMEMEHKFLCFLSASKRLFTAFLLSVLCIGCTTPGYKEREASAREMEIRLQSESDKLITERKGEIGFEDALELARERSLKTTSQDLEATLSGIQSDTAFSVFLPKIEAMYGNTTVNGHGNFGPYSLEMDNFHGVAKGISFVQPVFAPTAWVMYAETRHGKRAKEIVALRARELLELQVAYLYHQASIASRLVSIYEVRIKADESLVSRVTMMHKEGFALESDCARAAAKLASDRVRLKESQNNARLARGKLSEVLRLWPLAEYSVDGGTLARSETWPWVILDEHGQPRVISSGEAGNLGLVDCVWQGLVNRKELYAGDEMIEIRGLQVKQALASFLPNMAISGGSQFLRFDDLSARFTSMSFLGTISLFNGFTSVNAYKSAKAANEAEYLLQEDRMLSVITSVLEAWQNWKLARERLAAAELAAKAAELDYAIAEQKMADSQETMSNVLDKLAVRDTQQVVVESARYSSALACLALRQAMGIGFKQKDAE